MGLSDATAIKNLMNLGVPAAVASQIASLASGGAVLSNSEYLQWRNFANTADLDVLTVNSANETTLNSSTGVSLNIGGNPYFSLLSNGNFVQDATRGGSLLMTRAGTSVAESVSTGLVATGTTIADALQLTAVNTIVATVAAGTGVKLFDAPVGSTLRVQNTGANNLEVYPPTAGSTINGAALGGGITLAAATDDMITVTKVGTTTWWGFVTPCPAT